MTRFSRPLALAVLALAATTAACHSKPPPPTMTPEETQRVSTLTLHLVPRCVGRYLIDLPESFVLNSQSRTEVEGVEIVATPMPQAEFNAMLKKRQATYADMRLPLDDYPYLRDTHPLGGSAIGAIFDRNEQDSSSMRAGRVLELHGWKNGFAFDMRIKAVDATFPELQSIEFWRSKGSDVPQKMAALRAMYERVRGRADTDVPTGPGLCFANGFLAGPPTAHEWVDMYHHMEDTKDVAFSYHYMTDLEQDDELLDRGADIERMLAETNGKTLRKGKAAAQIPDAQEWLMSRESGTDTRRFQHFTLESNAKRASATTPLFIADFDVGVEIPGPELSLEEAAVKQPLATTTFNEGQTLAIWDKVIPTLRPRPGAF